MLAKMGEGMQTVMQMLGGHQMTAVMIEIFAVKLEAIQALVQDVMGVE